MPADPASHSDGSGRAVEAPSAGAMSPATANIASRECLRLFMFLPALPGRFC